jgi:nucleotide-binding universal stress UspA family protein
MASTDILCTTDLTAASDRALGYALRVAERADAQVTLFHVAGAGEHDAPGRLRAVAAMEDQVKRANGGSRVRTLLVEGNFMERIAEESAKGHQLAVLGTHGPRGIRQKLFGADILKLVRKLAIPALVVQEESSDTNLMDRIVVPVAAHSDLPRLMNIVCHLARLCAAEVHVYQLMRPHEEPSEDLLNNKRDMLLRLRDEGIRHLEVNEPSTIFSVGFAEPTIRYAQRVGAGCIAMMAHPSDEYRYIADAEKERLLTNDAHIPVLCA